VAGSINFQMLMKSKSHAQRRCVAYHVHFIRCTTALKIIGISEESTNVAIDSDFLLLSTFGCGTALRLTCTGSHGIYDCANT
jgi:hypothetical protein